MIGKILYTIEQFRGKQRVKASIKPIQCNGYDTIGCFFLKNLSKT